MVYSKYARETQPCPFSMLLEHLEVPAAKSRENYDLGIVSVHEVTKKKRSLGYQGLCLIIP